MNVFTTRIANDEERRRIASRSPVDVFIPVAEDTQYVSDFTGNYWPFRSMTVSEVMENRAAAERTINRTTSFAIIDSRPPGSNFPLELYELGDELHADYVSPVTYSGVARDAIAYPVETYRNYDFQNEPQLITPVPDPYGLTISCIENGLYQNADQHQNGVQGTSHPTDFILRELDTHAYRWDSMRDVIERLHEATSGDINIHLHEPPLSGDMIRYIRANPGAIDSIVLPKTVETLTSSAEATTESDALEESLSRRGNTYLRSGLCPFVRVAGEFSLLCSSFVDITNDRELMQLLDESVIPKGGGESVQPLQQTDDSQGTLTSLISD